MGSAWCACVKVLTTRLLAWAHPCINMVERENPLLCIVLWPPHIDPVTCASLKNNKRESILLKNVGSSRRLYSRTRGSFLRAFILAGATLWQWQQLLEASLEGTPVTRVWCWWQPQIPATLANCLLPALAGSHSWRGDSFLISLAL